MSPARKPSRRTPKARAASPPSGLSELGLDEGEAVRFRRRATEHWKDGTAVRREADGSLRVRDEKGSLRTLPLELVEVRTLGPRGGVMWEPLPERAARPEQMKLL